MQSTLEVRDGRLVVVRSGDVRSADGIRREARILAAIAGTGVPAVLEFVDDGWHAELVVAVAPPLNLAAAPTHVALDALARIADVLQRANTAGIGHGPIRDDDIVGDGTCVLLAGWQRGTEADPAQDVVAFGRVVDRLAAYHGQLRPIATRALALDAPTFAALAAALRAAVPHPVLDRHPLSKWPIIAAIALAVAAAAFALRGPPSHRDRAVVLDLPAPVAIHDNVVERSGRRWVVGEPGDVVVTGAWNCDAQLLPAVLRSGTGRVWLFRSWPSGAAPVIDRRATEVPGAVDLRVEHDGRCDRLVAVNGQGRAAVVR